MLARTPEHEREDGDFERCINRLHAAWDAQLALLLAEMRRKHEERLRVIRQRHQELLREMREDFQKLREEIK